MTSRHLLVLSLLAAVACKPKDDTSDDTDTDTVVADTEVDTDTDLHSDTVVDSDTDSDSDTLIDTDIATVTIQSVRRDGAAIPGDMVRIEDVVVIGARLDGSGFVVQDPRTVNYSGMVVLVSLTTPIPAPGTRVTLVGRYRELGGGTVPLQTTATIDATSSVPGAEVTTLGTTTLPTPYNTSYTVSGVSQPEAYESMIAKVSGGLIVSAGPAANGSFELQPPSGGTKPLGVGAWFLDPSDGLEFFGPGASFASIRGVFEYDGKWTIQPLAGADLFNYHAPDTDVPPFDTDTGDSFPVIETGCTDTDCGDSGAPLSEVIGTPQKVHQGLYTGDYTIVTVQDVVVTAVHDGRAAQDWFTIQTPTGSVGAALWIDATDAQAQGLTLPSVGDSVDVTGMYVEYNVLGGGPSLTTQSRLKVNNQVWPQTTWAVKSSGNPLPAAVDVSVADFQTPATMEAVESAIVRLVDAQDLEVKSLTGPQIGLPGAPEVVQLDGTAFYAMSTGYTVRVGALMTSVTGIAVYRFNTSPGWRLGPRASTDFVNYR